MQSFIRPLSASFADSQHSITPTRWLTIMPHLKLRKLLTRKEIKSLIAQFATLFDVLPIITDEAGVLLWGEEGQKWEHSFVVQVGPKIFGWVKGNKQAEIIANFLNCFVKQEMEKKSLASEILQKYEEVNFLSDFSAKISRSIGLENVVSVIIQETKQLVKATDILILLYQPDQCNLVSPLLLSKTTEENFKAIFAIAHQTLIEGKAEIVNDIVTDSRYIPTEGNGRSLMLAPLKIQNQVIGIFAIIHNQANLYNSEDLNLFLTLSSQAAAAIQTVQYYEKLKDYSQNLEQEVIKRTHELKLTTEKLEKANLELKKLAIYDELTQIPNRRYFNQYLHQEWKRSQREIQPLSLILCDVDYFKGYNDYYGHQMGDQCLQQVATLIAQSIKRPADLASRYGGEEFAIILPNTDIEGATRVAEHIKCQLVKSQIPHFASKISPWVTVSLGVSSVIPTDNQTLEQFIRITDKALFRAKQEGRNRVCVHSLMN